MAIKRKPAPYGHCISSWDETEMDESALMFDEGSVVPYTQGVKNLICSVFNIIFLIYILTHDIDLYAKLFLW